MPLFVLPFPAIDPILFQVGPFALRWYALAYIIGILLAWKYMRRLVLTDRLWDAGPRPTPLELDDFVVWGTLGIILGGRIGYVLFYNSAYYFANPAEALAVWTGGMSFHGGFIGTIIAMLLFAWKKKLSIWRLFDLAGTAAPIGLFFGRIANFINAELWGRTTDVPWAVVFPGAGPDPRHPSQLYEAALEGALLFGVMVWGIRRGWLATPGRLIGVFLLGYGAARMFVELFRQPDAQFAGPDNPIGFAFRLGEMGLTMGQILSLPMLVAGLAILMRRARN